MKNMSFKNLILRKFPVFAIGTLMLFMQVLIVSAQNKRIIRGTVVDEAGEPAMGATIIVKETSSMTVTGLDGKFQLSIPGDAKEMEVSYVGYLKQTVKLPGKEIFNIRLVIDNVTLDEVVVIGYGTTKKGNLTGAIASVKGEDLEDQATGNIANSLQGMLAGVEVTSGSGAPGEELAITIRGTASINADDTPLYVVDGIPVDDLGGLSPNDIASIEILKDASSSAIYGSRGANGVVLITTKTAGESDRVSVSVAASYGIQQLDQKIDVMSGEEWMQFRSKLNDMRYVKAYANKGATANDDWDTRLGIIGSVKREYMNDPRWSQPGHEGLAMVDWQDEFFRLAPVQNYSIAVANSTKKTKYRVSIGYFDQQGIAIQTSYKRFSFRTNVETKLSKWLTLGVNVTPVVSWSEGGNVDGRDGTSITALSMCPVAEADAGANTGAEPYPAYSWAASNVSPVARMNETKNSGETLRLQTSAFARAQIIKDLRLEITGSYNYRSNFNHYFRPSSVTSNWGSTSEGDETEASRTIRRYHSYLLQGVFNYSKEFNGHGISAMLGYSMEHSTSTDTRLRASDFPDNSQLGFSMGSEEITLASASIGTPGRMMSFFGRLQYEYDNRFAVTASLRRDGSTRFGRNNRWGTFPSVGATYRISNEDFWPKDFVVNSLKVRASWGMNGNNSIRSNASVGLMGNAAYSQGGKFMNGYAPTTIDNVDLGWEKTHSWNLGLDMGLFRNRITIGLDVYRKLTKDMLYEVSVPASMGLKNNKAWDNVGSIENKGFEIEVGTKNLTGILKWATSFNIGFNKNKVLSLGDNNTTLFGGWSNANTHVFMVGEPTRSYYMYDAVGVYRTQEDLLHYPIMSGQKVGDVRYRDVNGDGIITDADRTLVGKARPDYTFGMNNRFNYKKFDLSISISGQLGGYLYSMLGRNLDRPTGNSGTGNLLAKWKNMWISEEEPGDGKTPSFFSTTTTDLYDTRWLYKTDFIKIRNVTFGYTIPINRKIARKARVYCSIQNLWTWDKYDGGFSPEASTYGSKKTGYDYGSYPMARVYTLGVNLNF